MSTQNFQARLYAFVLNPWVVLASLVVGGALGLLFPALGRKLDVVGIVYVDLLKMIVLPFMVSAVIFSLQRLFREGGVAKILPRMMVVFAAVAVLSTVIATFGVSVMGPGSSLSEGKRQSFGAIVGGEISNSNTEMSLMMEDTPPKEVSLREIITSLVPANIFASLANGETLKALVFALLFGFAVGQVPMRISEGLTAALDTIYQSCQTLTRWLNYPLPLVLVCMSAFQMADSGLGPLRAMTDFLLALVLVTVLLLALAVLLLARRAGCSVGTAMSALQAPFAVAVATRSSASCMPMMIEALVDKLQFARVRVELLVPLSISLLRVGPMVYFACATIFIAQLYDRSLSGMDLGIVILASILAGFASAGMTGLVTVSLISMTAGYLGLPFEAAFILFLAIDPICDILRTLLLVIGNTAVVAAICPRPLKL
jgi:Na+/H+-dicarboxylate symporter